jgi:hemerythrin-like domain-containing protein
MKIHSFILLQGDNKIMLQTITGIMLKEHVKLDKMLEEFENSLETDIEKSRQLFSRFKWNLDKHFFIEEKVIFHVYNAATKEESEEIMNLLKEHKDMQWLINKMEGSIKTDINSILPELKKILKIHVGVENMILYPKLDEELDEKSKGLILERVEEIIR